MNSGRVEAEDAEGNTLLHKTVVIDPFTKLYTPGPHPHSHVGMQVGTQHDFGRIRITAVVDLECDQNEAALNEAGLQAFSKALELMTDGIKVLTAEPGK